MKQRPVNNITVVNQPYTKSFLKALFTGADGKLAVITIGFLIWITAVTIVWVEMSLENNKLAELPPTIVHLTLALGATKVTHRLAENDWSKVISQIICLCEKKRNGSCKNKKGK